MEHLQVNLEQAKVISLDSRLVAEMAGKEHSRLMKDIRRYSEYLKKAKLPATQFWVADSYTAKNGKTQPCYQITKKGCEFIQHKMTGEKGAIFTAKYINAFWELGEQQTQLPYAPQAPQPRISVDAECDYLDRLAQALLDADNRADKLTEIRKMHTFASVMMGKVDFTRYTLSRVQK